MDYYGDNIFTGIIDQDGVIYKINGQRKGPVVGVDSQKEQEYQNQIVEMQGIIDNYYNKLVDLGEIVPPKSAEEIAMAQAEEQKAINQSLMSAIEALTEKMTQLSAPSDIAPHDKKERKKPVIEISS